MSGADAARAVEQMEEGAARATEQIADLQAQVSAWQHQNLINKIRA